MLKVLQCHDNEELSTTLSSFLLADDNPEHKTTILLILKLQKEYHDQMELKSKIYHELEKSCINTEEMILREEGNFEELKKEFERLKATHPTRYMKGKKVLVGCLNSWYRRWKGVKKGEAG